MWRLEVGQGGVGQAAWCPDRARARAERRGPVLNPAGMAELEQSLDRLRRMRLPEWVVFAPHEDVFVESADPKRRAEVLAMARRVLAQGIGLALTTRGALRDAEGLVELARENPDGLTVRVGIFGVDPRLEERWERGLAPWSHRLALAKALKEAGAQVEVELGPIIPFVNDDPKRLRDALRAIARAGIRAVAPRWLEDGPGLEAQIVAEVSPSAGRLANGWFQQPGSNVGSSQRRIIPMQVRRTRLETIEEAARGLGLHVLSCACVEQGAATACLSAPHHVASEQLGLGLGT
ncbi:MAG: radical SAM protein [Myxococcota bacterium]